MLTVRKSFSLYFSSFLGFFFSCTEKPDSVAFKSKNILQSVNVVKPSIGTFVGKTSFVGIVESQKHISVHFLIPGRVEQCRLREGDKVKEGEEICRLDMSIVNLEVERAKRALNAASNILKTNLHEKQKSLFESGVIGQTEYEQVRVQSETMNAQKNDSKSLFDLAIKKQNEHLLKAPWKGFIVKMLAKPGQPIAPEIPALILSDEGNVQVTAALHASLFNKINKEGKAYLTSISTTKINYSVPLQIISKSPAINPSNQTFNITFGVLNNLAKEELINGIIVGGEVEVNPIKNSMMIPETSLFEWNQSGDASVFVVTNNKLELIKIKVDMLYNGQVQVISGLSLNSLIVKDIGPDLTNGIPVRIVN